MALTLKHVPEQTFFIGPSAAWRTYQATPAASDYATGGYLIPPSQVGMANIIGAMIVGVKYVSAGTIIWQINQPAAAYGTSPVESTTGVYLTAWQAGGVAATGTISKPTFTVKTGTALANGTINLDADAATANVVGGTGITADRTLTTTSPVGTPTFTGSATAAADFAEVAASTDLSGFPLWIVFIGY